MVTAMQRKAAINVPARAASKSSDSNCVLAVVMLTLSLLRSCLASMRLAKVMSARTANPTVTRAENVQASQTVLRCWVDLYVVAADGICMS